MTVRRILAILIAAGMPSQALSTSAPTLRAQATVTTDVVRLGDLVEGAGAAEAATPLFAAPAPGERGILSAARVLDAASENGVHAVDTGGRDRIVVIRTRAATLPEPSNPAPDIPKSATMVLLSRPVARGDTIRADDLTREVVTGGAGGPARFLEEADIVGRIARRALPAGQPLRDGDVARPELVTKGASVTAIYSGPGLRLTMRMKALESGALGDLIAVQNPNTKRSVSAVIAGNNAVTIEQLNPALAAR